jgi:hypothetical protein
MTSPKVEPVRKSVVVNIGAERAFTLSTNGFDAIKPREHVGIDGSRCRWSRVLVFDPPYRIVFSWDIGPTWQVEADPSKTSEVEVRFIAESDDRTRVELEHRHLERHGEGWRAVADGVGGDAGWPLYLTRYGELTAAKVRR